jgi:hypothetical protein
MINYSNAAETGIHSQNYLKTPTEVIRVNTPNPFGNGHATRIFVDRGYSDLKIQKIAGLRRWNCPVCRACLTRTSRLADATSGR